MNKSEKQILNCIGAGKVGVSLCNHLAEHVQIGCVINTSKKSADQARELIADNGIKTLGFNSMKEASAANFWMISCSDDNINQVAKKLQECKILRKNDIVFHCSGNFCSDILRENIDEMIHVASIHPIMSFSRRLNFENSMKGVPISIEGDKHAVTKIKSLITLIQADPITISASDKVRYHIASVFASNYITGIIDLSYSILETTSDKSYASRKILDPLIRGNINNYLENGAIKALTGPISRGDVSTVMEHLTEIKALSKDLLKIYIELGKVTLELARKQEGANQQNLEKINALFYDASPRKKDLH